jgi:cysteine-rich repeat protein
MSRIATFAFALAATLLLAAPDAAMARPGKCLQQRYVLGAPAIPGEPRSNVLLIDAGGKVALSPCGVGKGKSKNIGPKNNPKGDKLTITWPKCPGASDPKKFKNVKLTATILPDCSGLTKTSIKGKNVPKTSLTGRQSTGCGDGLIDVSRNEACDSGAGCPAGQECTATCACVTPTTTTTTSPTTSSTGPTTTSTTSTTTSTTTTTTEPVPSGCFGDAPNGVVDAGEECDDNDPAVLLGCNNCRICGNGISSSPQEVCDDGNLVCGDGCDNCVAQLCGDGLQGPCESCDDNNTSDADLCPADCSIDTCTPKIPSSQFTTVSFNAPSTLAGMLVLLDYPEGKIVVSGSGPTATGISGLPGDTTFIPNDLDHALRLAINKNTPFTGFGTSGQLFKVDFLTCEGASAPVAGEFTCKVLGANGPAPAFADLTAGTTCTVTVP